MTGQIQWNRQGDGLTATLMITCQPDGTLHMETPSGQGDFMGDYPNAQEACQGLVGLFEQGLQQAKQG